MSTFRIRSWLDLSAEEIAGLPLGTVCVTSDQRQFERVQTATGPMWCDIGRLIHEPPPPCVTVQIPVTDEIPFVEIQPPPPSPFADTLAWFRKVTGAAMGASACACETHEVPPAGKALGASVSFYCPEHGYARR